MIIRFIYTLALTLIAPLLIWELYRSKGGKPRVGARWKEHWGVISSPAFKSRPIWIHAVSVGEMLAAIPLIERISSEYPDCDILITTTTTTGAEQAKKLSGLATHLYMPFDFPFAVKRFINTINPSQLLIMETELWPNTLHIAKQKQIPVTIVNARLSDKSLHGYRRVWPIVNQISKCIHKVLCQHQSDVKNFELLGFSQEKLATTGSIKFDIQISTSVQIKGTSLRATIGKSRPVWIAASTHAGEDDIILSAHKKLQEELPTALLILVPRHPERFKQVELLAKKDFHTIARSSRSMIEPTTQVYLGDSMGEMLELISASDICFMGGSLVGRKAGGHNLLEPAALAKPILTGPSYYNFKEVTNTLIANGGCEIIHSDTELAAKLYSLFIDHQHREELGQSVLHVVQENSGAVDKTMLQLTKIFAENSSYLRS